MINQPNIPTMRLRLLERMSESGWDRILSEFINSLEFNTLMRTLYKENSTKGMTPSLKEVFNAFYECPFKDLKVVILGQDPYPQPDVADGIAFSCSNTMKVQPSLKIMFKEIERLYPSTEGYKWDPDLRRWSNQGILLINTALTTVPGKIGQHYQIWKPFNESLLKNLVDTTTGIIYVFMGGAAKEWARKIPESNYKLFCYHPASASYSGDKWNSNDVFVRINDILESANNQTIIW